MAGEPQDPAAVRGFPPQDMDLINIVSMGLIPNVFEAAFLRWNHDSTPSTIVNVKKFETINNSWNNY